MSDHLVSGPVSFSVDSGVGAAKLDAVSARIGPIAQALATAPATLRGRLQARLQSVRDEPAIYQGLLLAYQALLERVEVAVQHASQSLGELERVLPQLAAPWPVQQLGQQAADGLVPRAQGLPDGIATDQLRSRQSWRGPGAAEFAAAMTHQVKAADSAAEDTAGFSETLLDYGNRAVADVEAFLATAVGQLAILAESVGPLTTISGSAAAAARVVRAGDVLATAVSAITQTAGEQAGQAGQALASQTDSGDAWPSVRAR